MRLISFFRLKINNKDSDPFNIKEGQFRFGSLNGFSYRKEWTENTFYLDAGKREMIGNNFDQKKIILFGLAIGILLFIILARTAYLQVIRGAYYYSLSEGNRVRVEIIEPKRGIIYDRQGRTLAMNSANFILYLIPYDLPIEISVKTALLDNLHNIIGGIDKNGIMRELEKIRIGSIESYQPVFVRDNIEYETAMKLYLASADMPGVMVAPRTRRKYDLYSSSLSHVLGYTGKISPEELKKYGKEYSPLDYIGKMGVEYFWESELKGISGKKRIEVDALGKEKKIISTTDPIDGHNLLLSLDVEMQKKLEDIIAENLQKMKLGKASAVVMDPDNGEILALVSFPAYDNNVFARGITQTEYQALLNNPDNPLFNRAVSGEFPSGSTIKPLWSAAALQEGIINANTSIISVGGLRIGEWFFPDWLAGGHGITDVKRALAQSVNTFYYYIGGGYNDFKGMGIDKMVVYGEMFGLGQQTGIDLSGEAEGFLPTKEWKEEAKGEKWYIGDTYHMAIGQGDLLVTPLQVANYTMFFANGGKLYRPHLIREVLEGDDKPFGVISSVPVKEGFINPENIKIVREGMRETVKNGSARRLLSLPVMSAGKTGTAQWSTKKSPHAWYTGFAPYDSPELVYTILVEEGVEGSAVSLSIAQEFLQWYFTKKDINPAAQAAYDDDNRKN
jgi:penicillin-binding protein 2